MIIQLPELVKLLTKETSDFIPTIGLIFVRQTARTWIQLIIKFGDYCRRWCTRQGKDTLKNSVSELLMTGSILISWLIIDAAVGY